jgi:hypothetical protein
MSKKSDKSRQLRCRDTAVYHCINAEISARGSGYSILPFLKRDFAEEVRGRVEGTIGVIVRTIKF